MTWTQLLQGIKSSPTKFDEALHEDLGAYWTEHPRIALLQYVDDLLIGVPLKTTAR